MTLWDLPGPTRFIESCRKSLANGSNLVVRFPGGISEGFDDALMSALGNTLHSATLTVTDSPLKDLARQFADFPGTIGSLPDLLKQERFGGCLIWLDGFDESNWLACPMTGTTMVWCTSDIGLLPTSSFLAQN